MPIERYKNVTIGEREFRVGLLSAAKGSWVITQMVSGRATEFDVHQKIQDFLFSECFIVKHADADPIAIRIYGAGRWLVPDLELEYDLDTVTELEAAAFEFNFGPFLRKLQAQAMKTQETAASA